MRNMFRLLGGFLLFGLSLTLIGCGSDFYLSESEAAAYTNLFHREADANNFISNSLPNQVLDVQFDNASQPPTIRSTNLVTLMRNYTTLGLVEGLNHQVQLDRLNTELQAQMQNWIRNELQLYTGTSNASARLSKLTSVQVRFLNKPTFTFHPERQAIAYSLSVRLTISGTIEVNALDAVSNLIFGVNGTYPLSVDINNLNLNGEAAFLSTWADASRILFTLTPQPGTITVADTGSTTAPSSVKNGVNDTVRQQISQPLTQSFTQKYDYFDVTGLGLTQGTTQTPGTLTYTYQMRPQIAKPMLHIVARGTDGKLYHMRKTEGGQNVISSVQPFPGFQTSIQNEPTLCASDADQLELAATDVNGDLIYAHWRDEAWINQTTFAPSGSASATGYMGKPAIVATAPGQLEIIVTGRGGGLWHFRRRNGVWLSPVAVPLAAFASFVATPVRDPAAVVTGNKVVVVFVDAQNRLRALAYDLEASYSGQPSGLWGQPTPVPTQESINYAPAPVASGDGRVDVVYIGQSGTPYQRSLDVQAARFQPGVAQTGISIVGTETNIGGNVNTSPALVCSSYRQLEMIARGTDNRLYHNHFVGPASPGGFVDGRWINAGWQGWTDLNGNFSGSLTFESMNAFSAAVTRTGKVEIASIAQPNAFDQFPDHFIYQNSYDSERFGTQPWKTVLWRGYEMVGQQRFVGQPALAATDRHIAAAYVNNNLTLQRARLTESNYASFVGVDNSTQLSFSTPVDPVIVSTLPGWLDAVVVGIDGQLRHIRRGLTTTLPAPANVTFTTQPAVIGFGNGQLEVVAVGNNLSLYHWRLQNGSWTNAMQVSGSVISQPILVSLGSGQLLLLAVGGDHHLYFWYFTDGAWSGYQGITTSFLINQNLFGPLAASSWGDGSVDLALTDWQTGGLYQGRIGPGYFTSGFNPGLTPSRAFTTLGGNLIDTPVLTAFGPTRLHVMATGTDHNLYSNWSSFDYAHPSYPPNSAPPIVWSGYNYIGGYNVVPGGVAKSGANELTTIGTDTSGRVMLSRSTGTGWTQFQPVLGQTASTQLSPPRFRLAVATFNN